MVKKSKKRQARQDKKSKKRQTRQDKKNKNTNSVLIGQMGNKAPNDKTPRIAPDLARAEAEKDKTPRVGVSVGSRLNHKVTWCITRSDTAGEWSWGELREWTDDELNDDINGKFKNFEALSWGEVNNLSSGSGHRMHHPHKFGNLPNEVQDRWFALNLDEFADDVFRFRLTGRKRAWGYILQAHFYLVWFERNHMIYPVK